MKTTKIKTFKRWKRYGCNYYPIVARGKLLIANFDTNPDGAPNNKARLIVSHTVVYNYGNFAAVHYAVVSRYRPQYGWCYFVDSRKVTWRELSWDRKCIVIGAFLNLPVVDYMRPPTRAYRRWAKTTSRA